MPRPFAVSGRPRRSGTLLGGGVSERPKEHASKACEGATPPWVQIPPPPPFSCLNLDPQHGRQVANPNGRYLAVRNCPACGASAPADASWCGQCYAPIAGVAQV